MGNWRFPHRPGVQGRRTDRPGHDPTPPTFATDPTTSEQRIQALGAFVGSTDRTAEGFLPSVVTSTAGQA